MGSCAITIEVRGKKIDLHDSDIWFIEYIRVMGYGKLSDIEIQNGRIVMIKKMEKKIRPELVK